MSSLQSIFHLTAYFVRFSLTARKTLEVFYSTVFFNLVIVLFYSGLHFSFEPLVVGQIEQDEGGLNPILNWKTAGTNWR